MEGSILTDHLYYNLVLSKTLVKSKVWKNLRMNPDQEFSFIKQIIKQELIKITTMDGSISKVTWFTINQRNHGRMMDWTSFFSIMNIYSDKNFSLKELQEEQLFNIGLRTKQFSISTMQTR